MKRIFFYVLFICAFGISYGQNFANQADSLMNKGLLVPALEKYSIALAKNPTPEISYKIASAYALLWTAQARDSAFSYLNHALKSDKKNLKYIYFLCFVKLDNIHSYFSLFKFTIVKLFNKFINF